MDVCIECESLKIKLRDKTLNDNAKRVVTAELIVHKRRAKKFYKKMEEYSKNTDPKTLVIAFDYMQNLPLPSIPVQDIFYLRQLWVYLFGVHDLISGKAVMYTYHEGFAKKSPDEVHSLLNDYLTNERPKDIKKLVIFSDLCGGQKRNHPICRYLMSLTNRGVFEEITHYFPLCGHSFLPCDRDFGLVKRCVKRSDRIYTPEQYTELVLKSNNTQKFVCKTVDPSMVYSYKTWWPEYYKKTCISVETSGLGIPKDKREHFTISSYR